MNTRALHRLTLVAALALLVRFVPASIAALIVNPAQPITHQVTVQLIQTALDNGTSPAGDFGDATRRAAIESDIDTIWAQAGLDVNFLPNVVRYNNTFAYQGLVPTGVRPIQDLDLILSQAGAQGGILHSDPSILNLFFVNIVPGFDLKGANWANGVARVGSNGIAMFIGSAISAEHAAHWVAHEIGHNLGLHHTATGVQNLMGTSRNTELLTEEQISAIFQTQARNDAIATIPPGGTGFPKPLPAPTPGDYDRNGMVDAADYALWRSTLNSTTFLAADGNANGVIDSGDYGIWRGNFGEGNLGSQSSPHGGAPEPSSAAALLIGAAFLSLARRRRQV